MAVDILELDLKLGDRLIICSDGIHGVLTDPEITSLVTPNGRSLDDVCQAVIAEANARGGPDNATTVVVEAT
jgi:protein phosphatase